MLSITLKSKLKFLTLILMVKFTMPIFLNRWCTTPRMEYMYYFCNLGLLTVIFFKNDCDMQDMSAPVSTKTFVDIPLIEIFVQYCGEIFFCSIVPILKKPRDRPEFLSLKRFILCGNILITFCFSAYILKVPFNFTEATNCESSRTRFLR